MSFIDFFHKNSLKSQAASKIKIQQVLTSLSLNRLGNYLRDGPFSSDARILNSHPWERTLREAYIKERYFDSYGMSPPEKISKCIITKHKGDCLYSEYKNHYLGQKRDSIMLFTVYKYTYIFLTKILGMEFKCTVSNLCCQMSISHSLK